MAVMRLDEILKMITKLEKDLQDLYTKAERMAGGGDPQATIQLLKKTLDKYFVILNEIDPEKFAPTEYIAFDRHRGIFHPEIKDLIPQNIFAGILTYEEKLLQFYTHLLESAVHQKSKTLFQLLVDIKAGQIQDLKRLSYQYNAGYAENHSLETAVPVSH